MKVIDFYIWPLKRYHWNVICNLSYENIYITLLAFPKLYLQVLLSRRVCFLILFLLKLIELDAGNFARSIFNSFLNWPIASCRYKVWKNLPNTFIFMLSFIVVPIFSKIAATFSVFIHWLTKLNFSSPFQLIRSNCYLKPWNAIILLQPSLIMMSINVLFSDMRWSCKRKTAKN